MILLNENNMLLYSEEVIRKVIKSCINYEKSIRVFALQEQDIHTLISHLKYERPVLFHLSEVKYTFFLKEKEAILYPQYLFNKSEYDKLLLCVQDKTEVIKNMIMRYSSDYTKELKVHDYICQNVLYKNEREISHSIIGPLVYSCGVCDGISKTTKLLLQLLGIKAHVITGTARNQQLGEPEAHAWNVVKIDNGWYHLDVTFDKTITVINQRYDYFNISTKEISKDHAVDLSSNEILAINSEKCDDYYVRSGVYFNTLLALEGYLKQQLTRKMKYIQLRASDEINKKDVSGIFNSSLNALKIDCTYRQSINCIRNVYEWEFDYSR